MSAMLTESCSYSFSVVFFSGSSCSSNHNKRICNALNLYDTCVMLKALCMKHYKSTQPNFDNALHSSLRLFLTLPRMRTDARVHTHTHTHTHTLSQSRYPPPPPSFSRMVVGMGLIFSHQYVLIQRVWSNSPA